MKNFVLFWGMILLLLVIYSQALFPSSSRKLVVNGIGHQSSYQFGLVAQKSAQRSALVSPFTYSTGYKAFDNWSGYFVGSGSGGGLKGVQGDWNVQCFSGSQSNSIQETTWVGLGGWYNEGLVQTGTWKQPNGLVYLWWEAFNPSGPGTGGPNNGYPVFDNVNISCGHHIHAQVLYHPSNCSNGFMIQVKDTTTGHSFNGNCQNLTGGHQSADWIDERPDCGQGYHYISLADFNTTSWSNVLTQLNSSGAGWGNPNNYVNYQILMYDIHSNNYLASPDGLSVNNNNTFTDRWYNYGNSQGSCAP